MPTIQVNELTGAALDWAVAKCENADWSDEDCIVNVTTFDEYDGTICNYSTDWSQGGPIIEREGIAIDCIRCDGKINGWIAVLPLFDEAKYEEISPTPLIAAMRCFVASRLGNDVEVPNFADAA